MISLNTIYRYSPIFLQNIICSLYGWKEKKIRFNQKFFNYFNLYTKSEWLSEEEINSLKEKKLREVLKHSLETVPYYKNEWQKIEIDTNSSNIIEELTKLPILTKDDIRKKASDLLSSNVDRKQLLAIHTSGTTGKAITIYKHKESIANQWAIWYRHRNRFKCGINDLHVNFTGKQVVPTKQKKPPFWRFNKPLNQYLINMQHVSPEKIEIIVNFLNTIKPKFYSGYPSIMAEVARLALENNLELKDEAKPKYVFAGAENTLDDQKDVLERWTGALITDQYGLTEGNCNLSRCEYGNYHEDFEFCHIECIEPEYLPDGRKKGKLIGTAYNNDAMPLIRYDTGDIAIWKPDDFSCACGRKSTVIETIEGRIDDAVLLPDGRKIMRFDYLFKGTDSIIEAQVCQYKEKEVVIKIVIGKSHSIEVEEKLTSDFSEWYCKETKVIIEHVQEIEKTASGKFKAVKSFLNKG